MPPPPSDPGSSEYNQEFQSMSTKLLTLCEEMKKSPEVYAWSKKMLDEIPQFIELGEINLDGATTLYNFLDEEFRRFKETGQPIKAKWPNEKKKNK